MISTRGRYALRVMLSLAEQTGDGYTSMKSVAEQQGLSLKYMERIMPLLAKHRLVEGVHGRGGGYRLSKLPSQYKVGEILRITEGNLAPVSCLKCEEMSCDRAHECKTLPMWSSFHHLINDFFDGITLEDLQKGFVSSPK